MQRWENLPAAESCTLPHYSTARAPTPTPQPALTDKHRLVNLKGNRRNYIPMKPAQLHELSRCNSFSWFSPPPRSVRLLHVISVRMPDGGAWSSRKKRREQAPLSLTPLWGTRANAANAGTSVAAEILRSWEPTQRKAPIRS